MRMVFAESGRMCTGRRSGSRAVSLRCTDNTYTAVERARDPDCAYAMHTTHCTSVHYTLHSDSGLARVRHRRRTQSTPPKPLPSRALNRATQVIWPFVTTSEKEQVW